MVSFKSIKAEMKRYKKGLMVGLGVGAIAAFYVKQQGIDLMFAVQSQGVLDNIASNSPPEMVAFYKVLVTFMILGAFVGYFMEKNVLDKRKR